MADGSSPPSSHLRRLSALARAGLTLLMLALMGGYTIASLVHMKEHHENRDGREGFTLTDIEGVYHGVTVDSPLQRAMEAGHMPELPDEERRILLRWLSEENIAGNYDSPDFADFSPEEIININCLDCHRGAATEGAGISLTNWVEVQKHAFPNVVSPTDTAILLASTHAHASTMGVIGIVVALLACLTGWPRWLTGGLILLAGLGLVVDLGAMWLARSFEGMSPLIAGGGAGHSAAMALLMVMVVADMWRPLPRSL